MCFGQRPAKHGKILRKHIDQPPVYRTIAGNYAVAGIFFLLHTKIGGAVGNQHADLLERAFVHQKVQALARRKLALFMLTVGAGLAAAQAGLFAFSFNDFILLSTVRVYPCKMEKKGES